jgi:phage terminase small subunit
MRSGPKRKPTALHQLHGTTRQRHQAYGPDAIARGSLYEPPADLSEAEAAAWRQAIDNAPAGVLAAVDASLLRLWCVQEARFLKAKAMQEKLDTDTALPLLIKTKAGDMAQSPYIGIMTSSTKLMMRLAEQLGFCPSARVGLGQGDEGAADPADSRWLKLEGMRRKAANAS